MAKVTVQVEVDESKLNQFENFCNSQGDTMAIVGYVLPFGLETFKTKKTVSKRIGVAKGKLHVPDNFSEWDKEVEALFEDGDKI